MEKTIGLKDIQSAMNQLRERGERISRRSVQALTGGSMTSVHRLMTDVLAEERTVATVPTSELPETLLKAILGEIGNQVRGATNELECRISEMTVREQEILSDLEGSEGQIAALERELAAVKAQLVEERQAADKTTAVAVEQIAGLRSQLDKLSTENENLIRSGEVSRMEAAKALLQVERADIDASKAEARVVELEDRLSKCALAAAEAEKRAAVSEQHAHDLEKRIAELNTQAADRIAALNTQMADRIAELTLQTDGRIAELTDQVVIQSNALQADVATIERLRTELSDLRKTMAESDKRASLAEQKNDFLEGRLSDQKLSFEKQLAAAATQVKKE